MTATKEQLQALLKRVEALTESSFHIDAELYATIGGAPNTTKAGERIIPLIMKGDPEVWPAYTASVDAALALVERVAGGDGTRSMVYSYDLSWNASAHSEMAFVAELHVAIGTPPDMQSFPAQSYTLPLAILAALLEALIAQAEEKTA